MLTYFHFGHEKNHTHKKQVDGYRNRRMVFDVGPGPFHFGTPVDVVENKNAGVRFLLEQLFKISHGGCIAVVAIDISEVDTLKR